jgi:predicted GIY-YIG superfamily endonuclease
MHHCYILYGNNKTYVGYTTNPKRRLRQHNGEIQGGAKYTKRMQGRAKFLAIISPFYDKRIALQFEWAMKHHRPRTHHISGRIRKLVSLLSQVKKWTKHCLSTKLHPPLTIHWGLPKVEINARLGQDIEKIDFLLNVSHIFVSM